MKTLPKNSGDNEVSSEQMLDTRIRRPHPVLKTSFWVGIALAFVATTGAIGVVELKNRLNIGTAELPTLQDANKGVQFFDGNNKFLCTVRADRDREPVPLDKVSKSMRNALVSAEDHHFYEHHGIDFIGIARALKRNREAGRIVEGGSTITQQLVRNLYLDKNDKSYMRKIKEVFLSFDAENRFSKAKIMETYLNEIYFGGGVYGVERAANNYFDKHASELTVPEAAFIAGLIKSPSVYGNPKNRALAVQRQHEVLNKMAEYGYISSAEAATYKSQQLAFKHGASPVQHPYYIACALEEVKKEMRPKMWTEGLKVYTNLDPAAQKVATAKLTRGIKNAPRGVNQGALVSMRVSDGAVLSMVGGVGGYEDNQWNRAIFPHTAGSCFKPFVYLAGLMNGVIEPDTMINDEPISLKAVGGEEWKPKNFDSRFKGWVSVRDALINSRNICAIRIATAVGIERVIDAARAAGLSGAKMDPYPSLALGTCAVSPLEMATAYGTLARNGAYMPPQMIRKIETSDGKLVREFAATASANLPAATVATLVDAMQDVVNRGTGTQARLGGIPAAGKTGTADGARDIWFSGFTPDTVTVVWGGSDKNQAVKGHNVTGGTVMAHIWHDYMTAYYQLHRPTKTLAFAKADVKFAGPLPELNDETLLTTDAATVDVSDLSKLTQVEPTTVNPEQLANNVPTILANAIEAKEKGIGKAFIVLAAEAAERFQQGGGAAARQSLAYSQNVQNYSYPVPQTAPQSPPAAAYAPQAVSPPQANAPQAVTYAPRTVTLPQAASRAPVYARNQPIAYAPGQPTAEQMAYAQQVLKMQANSANQPAQGNLFEQPASASTTY